MEKRKGPDLIHRFLSNEKGLDHIKEKKKREAQMVLKKMKRPNMYGRPKYLR